MRCLSALVLLTAGCHFEVSGLPVESPDLAATGASCSDNVKNGDETDVDCGGAACASCSVGKTCLAAADCQTMLCNGTCRAPSCTDQIKDGTETDVDCGGGCPACANTKACAVAADCLSNFCAANACRDPVSCQDIKKVIGTPADGVYTINPGGAGAFSVYCDMTSDGGGWTLMATLQGTAMQPPGPLYNPLSDDWWAHNHGDATSPNNTFTNIDARRFKPLVVAGMILRATNQANAVRRYHFGFTPADWDLWNAGRVISTVTVVGPFELANVQVSRNLDLSSAVEARVNGSWSQGYFYLGSAPNGGDADGEGIHARFEVGTSGAPMPGYVGDVRAATVWSLWVRDP